MSCARPSRGASRWWLTVLAGFSAITCFAASEEPRWLRLSVPDLSLGADVEALHETANMQGSSSTHDYLSLIPVAGLHTQGSIYHPNLLSFDLSGEGGVGWATDSVRSPGSDETRRENRDLIRYLATVNLLELKPYNGSFFAAQDHTYQNYDFFNTATVDSFRYGGRASWTTPRLSLTLNAGYRDDRSDSFNGVSQISDTYLNFTGIDHRESGTTTLNYSHDEFVNRVDSQDPVTSVNNIMSLGDSQTFGSRKQITASLGGSYSQYSYFDTQNDTISGNGNFTINHTPTLDSFGTVNYTHNDMDPVTSSFLQGITGARHHLYESLVSTVDLHGSYDQSSSPVSSASNDRYGVGLREDYTKHLGTFGRLSLGGGVVADHNDQNSTGTVLMTLDEPHQLFLTTSTAYRPAYLNNPRVIRSSIEVRSQSGIPAQETLDYQVIQTGELTEIRLVQGSPRLRDGDTVLVTYQSESLNNASFESLNSFGQIRLDLFNILGIYGRVNSIDNNAPPEVLTETLLDLVGGTEVRWRWFHAGAEYEDFDSNFSKYKAFRFFENFSHGLGENSTVGVEFNQLFYKYASDGRDTEYQFIAHYNTRLTSWLNWNVEGGYFLQDFMGTQENLGAARTDLNMVRGKLSLKLGYQYNYQLTTVSQSQEERNRNFFYLSLRRYF
jgi:hypothetical protein